MNATDEPRPDPDETAAPPEDPAHSPEPLEPAEYPSGPPALGTSHFVAATMAVLGGVWLVVGAFAGLPPTISPEMAKIATAVRGTSIALAVAAAIHGIWVGRRLRRGDRGMAAGWGLQFLAGLAMATVALLIDRRGTTARAYLAGLHFDVALVGALGALEVLLAVGSGALSGRRRSRRGWIAGGLLALAAALWVSLAMWLEFMPREA